MQLQVLPLEIGTNDILGLDPERPGDRPGDLGRRGGRQREDPADPERFRQSGELEVFGAEIVPPLADAMRLVDGEHRDRPAADRLGESARAEPLGRDVEDPDRPRSDAREDFAGPSGVEARIEPGRRDPPRDEEIDLVLHQGDQGTRDHRQAVEQERRELIAEALASPRREDRQRRPPLQEPLDDLALPLTEVVEAEDVAEQSSSVNRGRHGGRTSWTVGGIFGCDTNVP